jgi:hypothetical protein
MAWHQAALDFGCMMTINPNAHSIPELVTCTGALRWHEKAASRRTAS